MLDIILQVLVCGTATAAICRIISYYDGPFRVLPRLKDLLVPGAEDEKSIRAQMLEGLGAKDISSVMLTFNDLLIKRQELEGKLAIWQEYQTKMNPKFYHGLRGTIYGLLDCPFCIGPYVSIILALISTLHMIGDVPKTIELVHVTNWALVSVGSLGLHFIISKQWAKEDGDGG